MLKNYFKIAFRNIRNSKGYSFINLLGLAIGMACCLLVFFYIQDELSYDRGPEKAGRIYRMVMDFETPDRGLIQTARTPPPWAPAMMEDFPEIENSVRFKTPLVSWLIGNDDADKRFHESGFYFADAAVFKLFDYALLQGDPQTALKEPNTLVLTETAAKKYFGDENPMGKTLRADNTYDLVVTGVMQDPPPNSHIRFDILASFDTLSVLPIYGGVEYATFQRSGLFPDIYTYILLAEGARPEDIEGKMPGFMQKYLGGQMARLNLKLKSTFQPLTKIHLHSNLEAEMSANSDISYIYIFAAVAMFILLIACINFMNLATARSAGRAREVGLRKVIGATKRQLVFQFLGESILMALLSMLLALGLAALLLPAFNALSGKSLGFALMNGGTLSMIIGIALFVGFLSGSYPSFYLSAFRPAVAVRGRLKLTSSNLFLRKVLVVFQFAVSVVFIIGTAVVSGQLRYVQNTRLGFEKRNVIVLPMGDPRARQIYQSFKDRVLMNPDVSAVTGANIMPGGLMNILIFRPEGVPAGQEITMETVFVDHDFLETLGIELIAGRTFSQEYPTDIRSAFILNETAVKQLGWEQGPLGKQIVIPGFKQGNVIGVAEDFHMKSLHQRIEPLVIQIAPDPDILHYLAIRYIPGNIPRTLEHIESSWHAVYPHDPFNYSFLDQDFDRLYRAEKLRGRVFATFALLTVFIACLGLLGLASFTAEQRTKEIGIRKVLGASVPSIMRLLSREFALLVLISAVIAWPLAYTLMHQWLQNFAYRTGMSVWVFLLAAVIAVGIALFTVSFQAFRASLADPVDTLRTE